MEKDASNPKQVSVGNTDNLIAPKSWNNIEPEMLIKIFALLYSPTNPKEMASWRLVCKHWRDVIDEHFEHWLTVNDTKFDLENIFHMRICNCTIVSLTKDLDPQQQIFKSPESLTKLSVWGEISPRNFHLVILEAVNLKHLSLNWKPLGIAGLMGDTSSALPEQEERVQEFWNELTTLEVSLDSKPLKLEVIENLCKMLSRNMRNLSTLKMRIDFDTSDWERYITALYSFLGNNANQNLKTFHYYWTFMDWSIPPPQSPLRLSGDNQLESLRILLIEELVPYWIPLIEAQRQLKDFRLNFQTELSSRAHQLTQFFQMVRTALLQNQSTLSGVELTKFNLADELDANIFQGMENLTRLVLQPCDYERSEQKILNLRMLPHSIETLVLGTVVIDSEELKLLVDRLDNLNVLIDTHTVITTNY